MVYVFVLISCLLVCGLGKFMHRRYIMTRIIEGEFVINLHDFDTLVASFDYEQIADENKKYIVLKIVRK